MALLFSGPWDGDHPGPPGWDAGIAVPMGSMSSPWLVWEQGSHQPICPTPITSTLLWERRSAEQPLPFLVQLCFLLPSLTEEPGDFNEEIFLTPGSAGPSSAPHGCPTLHGAVSSPLQARFAPAPRRGGGSARWEPARPPALTHSLFTLTFTHTHTQSLCHAWLSPARPTPPGSAMWATGLFRKELAKAAGNQRGWTGEVELEP